MKRHINTLAIALCIAIAATMAVTVSAQSRKGKTTRKSTTSSVRVPEEKKGLFIVISKRNLNAGRGVPSLPEQKQGQQAAPWRHAHARVARGQAV